MGRFFPECTRECAVPVPCPVCGDDLPPRARDVPLEMNIRDCCEEHRFDSKNTRHLWSVDELEDS